MIFALFCVFISIVTSQNTSSSSSNNYGDCVVVQAYPGSETVFIIVNTCGLGAFIFFQIISIFCKKKKKILFLELNVTYVHSVAGSGFLFFFLVFFLFFIYLFINNNTKVETQRLKWIGLFFFLISAKKLRILLLHIFSSHPIDRLF
jgi:hypothetical protein